MISSGVVHLGGGGGSGMTPGLCCCLKLTAPIGLSPLCPALSLNPFPPQTTLCPLPAWPILTSLLTLCFPWEVVPTEAPDCPRFTAPCRVQEANRPRRWPGASKWTPQTAGGGSLPNGGCFLRSSGGVLDPRVCVGKESAKLCCRGVFLPAADCYVGPAGAGGGGEARAQAQQVSRLGLPDVCTGLSF